MSKDDQRIWAVQQDPSSPATNLAQMWKGYQTDFTNQVEKMRMSLSGDTDTFSSRWFEITQGIQKQLSELNKVDPKEYKELYNTWKNYQNKLQSRLIRLSSVEYSTCQDLMDAWNKSTDELIDKVFEVNRGQAGSNDRNFLLLDVYNHWGMNSRNMTFKIAEGTTRLKKEYDELSQTWTAFIKNMSEIISELSVSNRNHEGVMEAWDAITLKMGSEMSRLLRNGWEISESLGAFWKGSLEHINGDLLRKLGGVNYEEYYSQLSSQMNFVPFVKSSTDAWYQSMVHQIDDLKVQIETLEKHVADKRGEQTLDKGRQRS